MFIGRPARPADANAIVMRAELVPGMNRKWMGLEVVRRCNDLGGADPGAGERWSERPRGNELAARSPGVEARLHDINEAPSVTTSTFTRWIAAEEFGDEGNRRIRCPPAMEQLIRKVPVGSPRRPRGGPGGGVDIGQGRRDGPARSRGRPPPGPTRRVVLSKSLTPNSS